MTRLFRALLLALLMLAVAVIGGGFWARGQLRASLPQVDGERRVPGLGARVEISRDALGIPTVRAGSRRDLARAMGFLHAQDRFFQMDLSRRRAAGEIAALVGAGALPVDREIRIHRFRPQARRAVELLGSEDRAVLDAYTAGVNAGLTSLGAKPFEYFLLQQDPVPWRPEDSVLVVLSMFITLQDIDGSYEAALSTMHDLLPAEMFALMAPRGTEWDSPVVGDAFETPPIPAAAVYNARARRQGRRQLPTPNSQPSTANSQSSTGNLQSPTSNFQAPTLNGPLSTPNGQRPTPHTQLSTADAHPGFGLTRAIWEIGSGQGARIRRWERGFGNWEVGFGSWEAEVWS
ncbi:MAG: penicillin acylase family protein [Vicinamibacterales bacterium]